MYANGLYVEQDFSKAVYWFKRAAQKGYPMAIFNLSIAYKNGDGVPVYLNERNRLISLASSKGLICAKEILTYDGEIMFEPGFEDLNKMYLQMHIEKVERLSVYII